MGDINCLGDCCWVFRIELTKKTTTFCRGVNSHRAKTSPFTMFFACFTCRQHQLFGETPFQRKQAEGILPKIIRIHSPLSTSREPIPIFLAVWACLIRLVPSLGRYLLTLDFEREGFRTHPTSLYRISELAVVPFKLPKACLLWEPKATNQFGNFHFLPIKHSKYQKPAFSYHGFIHSMRFQPFLERFRRVPSPDRLRT